MRLETPVAVTANPTRAGAAAPGAGNARAPCCADRTPYCRMATQRHNRDQWRRLYHFPSPQMCLCTSDEDHCRIRCCGVGNVNCVPPSSPPVRSASTPSTDLRKHFSIRMQDAQQRYCHLSDGAGTSPYVRCATPCSSWHSDEERGIGAREA